MTDLMRRRTLKESNPAYWEYEQKWLRGEIDNGVKVHFKLYSSETTTYEIDHPLVPANTHEFEGQDSFDDLNELRSGKDSSVRRSKEYIALRKFKEITARDRERISKSVVAYHKLRQSNKKKSKSPVQSKVVERRPEKQLDLFKIELMLFTHEHPEEGIKVIVWKDKQVLVCEYVGGRYCEYKGGRMLHAVYDTVDKWCYLPQE